MPTVAPPPQARAGEFVRVHFISRAAVLALASMGGCYSGLGPEDATPWDTAASESGSTDGAADGVGDDGPAGEGPSDEDGASAADGNADESEGGAADDDADAGSADDAADAGSDGAGSDGGSTGAVDDGAADAGSVDDGSADGVEGGVEDDGAADDGGAAEVPDNAFCDPVADWMGSWSTLEQQILDIVNERRAEGADCGAEGSFGPAGPLTMNPALRCAARVQSKQMVESDFFAHTTPWGETPGNRIDAAGYDWSTWGENIAAGNSTAAATMDQWMGSDGHCANIMNASFSEIGVGYFPGGGYGHYWTQAFGHP